jgi:hypothetical protein
MSEGPEEHLEHAEHAQHAAHSPFDRRVAMTIMVIAAVLAGIKMLSHRAHTETLRLLSEANSHQTEANINHVLASDQWSFYQAKNVRRHEYDTALRSTEFVAKEPSKNDALKQATSYWKNQVDKYDNELPAMKADAEALGEKGKEHQHLSLEKKDESEHEHHRAWWFDAGELGIEIALVICSIALLTKRNEFWYLGILFSVIGAVIAAGGLLPH